MRLHVRLAVLFLAPLLLMACGKETEQEGQDVPTKPTIVYMTDAIGAQKSITEALAKEFEQQTGVAVRIEIGPNDPTERLAAYQRFLGAKSPDIDIYMVDVVWPGVLGQHFLDLAGAINPADHFPAMIENNTINGRLVAAPYYADAGMLYYRQDLLAEHGFPAPPKTWDELAEVASVIQEAERASGNAAFHGFVFQGASYEGLTCNALEWQHAEGGGRIIDAAGAIDLDTAATARALNRVRSMVGTIAPRGVLTYKEEESHTLFLQGNAAFMRNWPYVWGMAQAEGSLVKGKIAVTTLPAGSARSASTLGGWTLAVSSYSKHPEEAKKFVAFLSTKEAQKRRAIEGGYHATRPDVYGDAEITAVIPYFDSMKGVFENAVARPASASGRRYNEISTAYFQAVHDILRGEDAAKRLDTAKARMQEILDRK